MANANQKLEAAIFGQFLTYRLTDEQVQLLTDVFCGYLETRALLAHKDVDSEVAGVLRSALKRYELDL